VDCLAVKTFAFYHPLLISWLALGIAAGYNIADMLAAIMSMM
jgi:hypothetical protein